MLSFVPDDVMLKWQYRIKFGRLPNFKNPTKYSEKIQLYKMLYRNPVMSECVDKIAVRDYISRLGLENILIKQYGIYERADDIPFNLLPPKFVIKTNDGSGGNNVLICKDRDSLDVMATVKKVNSWLNIKDINAGREWAYTGIKSSKIIVEEFLEPSDSTSSVIEDFKFFCFDGQPYMVQVDSDRYTDHRRNFYDLEWQPIDIELSYPRTDKNVKRPDEFNKMLEVVRIISNSFPHVRVDLYNVDGKIYFGEMTFYPGSGYEKFLPEEFDETLGKVFNESSFYSSY